MPTPGQERHVSIRVSEDTTRETRYYDRTIEIEGAPPVLLERRYSHGGKTFQPDVAMAKWNHGEQIKSIRVAGYVLKKDGAPGVQRTDVSFCTPASTGWGKGDWRPDAPKWLLDLFGLGQMLDNK